MTHYFTNSNKRVKETAAELTNLQSQLADYNLLVDKLNTDTEVILVQQEAQEMAAQNESESREVEALFAEKQNRYILSKFTKFKPGQVEPRGNWAGDLLKQNVLH